MNRSTGAWRPSTIIIGIALVMAVAVASIALLLLEHERPAAATVAVAPARQAAARAPTGVPAAASRVQAREPEGDADPTPDLSSVVARGDTPSMATVIERLHQRGIFSGLGAFSAPGTSPPMIGLAVPEDFVLPKGYVRHHQATDDGQRIEAILMFAPDFQLLDANNKPVKMPEDRVVPPDLAPAGLPIRRIVIPPPTDGSSPGH